MADNRNNDGRFEKQSEEEVKEKIYAKNGSFEYICDTTGDNAKHGNVYLMCKYCGDVFKRSKENLKPSRQWSMPCTSCEKSITQIKHKKRAEEKKRISEEKKVAKEKAKNKEHVCQNCGDTFTSKRKSPKYCSSVCMTRRNHYRKWNRKRNRLKQNGEVDSSITLDLLIKKEKNICYICGGECDKSDAITTKEGYFIVGQSYPTIEHLKPISAGGTHTWGNIKLAHKQCNERKGSAQAIDKYGQLKMIL